MRRSKYTEQPFYHQRVGGGDGDYHKMSRYACICEIGKTEFQNIPYNWRKPLVELLKEVKEVILMCIIIINSIVYLPTNHRTILI